jgi:hypothetical protein
VTLNRDGGLLSQAAFVFLSAICDVPAGFVRSAYQLIESDSGL